MENPMFRYPERQDIASSLDPITDLLGFLEYLTSKKYLLDVLNRTYRLNGRPAKDRAHQIIPHMRTAISFIKESLASEPLFSFLPAYYGILNLSKVYILLGPRHADLPSQRLHGVVRPVNEKDSQSILTEQLKLRSSGAFPLFYETLTGKQFPDRKRIAMREVYPFVSNIGAEYKLATGKENCIQAFKVDWRPNKKKKGHLNCILQLDRRTRDSREYEPRDFKALLQFKRDRADPDVFVGGVFPEGTDYNAPNVRAQFNPVMIYDNLSDDDTFTTPACSKHLLMPEELPIFLLFFHMSSVVRYNPEFLFRTRDSQYWPMLSAARRHCLLKMLILAWSFVHKTNLSLKHELA
jgi:hypothetical protein